jgi:hypothetical protein
MTRSAAGYRRCFSYQTVPAVIAAGIAFLLFLPARRRAKPNGARLRPASHYDKALRAFDRSAQAAQFVSGNAIANSGDPLN